MCISVSEGAQALHSVDDIPPGPCLKTTSWQSKFVPAACGIQKVVVMYKYEVFRKPSTYVGVFTAQGYILKRNMLQPSVSNLQVSFNLSKTSTQGVKCFISRRELHSPGETNSIFSLSKVLFSGGKEYFLAMFSFSSFIYSWIDFLSRNTHIIGKVLKAIYYPRVAQTWAIVTRLNPLLQVFFLFIFFFKQHYIVFGSIMLHFYKNRLGHVT